MALLAALVIFTVIARYCFSLSWKQLAEFNTTLFAFTTFWGMGINVIKDEHVMIDILYDGVKPARKRWLAIVNYLIVLAVVLVFTYQGFKYVGVAGKQISQGMEIPMMYMYGIMPLFIIICVSFGVCTASESAGVAVLYSMLVGFFVYKELTWKGVWEALKKTLISSSSIMLIIGFTTIFTWVLTMQKVPQTVGAFFMSLNMPAWAIALIFDVLILMIGTFIDVSPAILLLTPILLPVMVQYGFSPLQFGAMMITGLAIGLVTPPVGMCLNACNKINRMPIIEIFKGAAPYVICNVIVLISISLWGPLTTALPQLLGYSIF